MKFSSLFLSTLSALAVTSSSADSTLRGAPSNIEDKSTSGRRLQFDFDFGGFFDPGTLDLDQIIQGFLPLITQLLESILSTELEQMMIANNVTQELAGVELAPGCTGDAAISFLLGELQGLDSFQIDSVELVPGTGNLDLSFLGLNGASWSGVWDIVGTFADNIGLDTEAQVSADACGVLLNETAMGTILAENAGFEFQLGMDGSSPSIFDVADSFAESISLEKATFTFDSLLDNIDETFGGDTADSGFDLTSIFDGIFTDELMNQLLPAIQDLLDSAFSGGLPLEVGK